MRALPIFAALAAALAAPATAAAATVSAVTDTYSDKYHGSTTTTMTYAAAAGERNELDVRRVGEMIEFRDPAGIEAGPGCERIDAVTARCRAAEAPTSYDASISILLEVTLGDGDDRFRGNGVSSEVDGGAGGDTLAGGDYPVTLLGGEGDDHLSGGGGSDELNGGPGRDRLSGGRGTDRVSFAGEQDPVVVDLNGATLIGPAREQDEVPGSDFESVTGGAGDDKLIGASAGGSFAGGPGDDLIVTGGATDSVDGGTGRDRVETGAGDDQVTDPDGGGTVRSGPGADRITYYGGRTGARIFTGDGRDVISGTRGGDLIDPGGEVDSIDGHGGADVIRARDGETEDVQCAQNLYGDRVRPTGRAIVDAADRVRDCRRVDRPTAGVLVVSQAARPELHYSVATAPTIWTLCPSDVKPRCAGTASLFGDGILSSRKRFRFRPSAVTIFRLRLSQALQERMTERRCLRLTFVFRTRDSRGRLRTIRGSRDQWVLRGSDGSRSPRERC